MRLKRLFLSGFKSFCDETEFSFQENGVTVVVGPNGCGKSNVVDAMRWVLGEQSPRQLRGSAMGDVIFGGSISRKPIGRCEVTIVFDNSQGLSLEKYRPYAEISVTRRLYRSGESEYLINNLPCRLLDIRELVMDTGVAGRAYSIVEQGRVDAFITASPAERRTFVEEAAGIVRYKTRRAAAEKRLEQTDQNLTRVMDVLGELRRQEEALRGQVAGAREYLALKAEVGALRARLARARYGRSAARCRELEQARQALTAQNEQDAQSLALLQVQAERLQAEATVAEGNLRQARGRAYDREREIQRQESALALARQNRENARQWIARLEAQHQELHQKAASLATQRGEAQSQAGALEAREAALRARIEAEEVAFAEREAARLAHEAAMQALRERGVECHTTLTGLANQRRFLDERREEWRRRAGNLDEALAAARAEREQVRRRHEEQAARAAALAAELAQGEALAQAAAASLEAKALDRSGAEERLAAAAREALECRSRREALAELDAAYPELAESARAVLQWADGAPGGREAFGLLGPLADFIEVAPETLDWAGAFLAPYLELLVVRRAADLPGLERALAERDLGRVRLVTLDGLARLPLPTGTGAPETGQSFAELVRLPDQLEPLRQGLFRPVRLLPEGAAAHPLPEPEAGVEWLSADGRLHVDPRAVVALGRPAGAGQPPSVAMLRRRAEMEALRERGVALEAAREAAQARCDGLAGEIAALQARLAGLAEERQQHALARSRLEQAIDHDAQALARLDHTLTDLTAERERVRADLEQAAHQREELERSAQEWEARRTALERDLAHAQEQGGQTREAAEALGRRLTEGKVEHGRLHSRLEHVHSLVNTLATEAEEVATKQNEGAAELERQRALAQGHEEALRAAVTALGRLQEELQAERAEVGRLATHHGELTRRGEELAAQMKTLRAREEATRAKLHERELELTAERMRLEQWAAQLEGAPSEEREARPEPLEPGELERQWKAGQGRLERMEGVNLAAPEEYDALGQRLEFLERQREDLLRASEDLKESIRRMNQESRRRFKETFEQVDLTFQRIFPEVFGGGEGRLVLTDSDDLLVAGVDIVAQPPGKRLQSLSLLSGGEKALAAIALIFSFFLIKPSPFCVLDEVDAPLDDANVGRFNRLVRDMTDRTQFIMITHNRRTMESGDLLYGVTMEDAGVSKVVSVNLAEKAS